MSITITAFTDTSDGGSGQARDMHVRWALEEVGQPYEVCIVSFHEMKEPTHRALHPFGQIPSYEERGLTLFESGAILLHLAEHYAGLLPDDADARARAKVWLFAALNTVEPPSVVRELAPLSERDKPWYEKRLPLLDDRVRTRLDDLAAHPGKSDWLIGAFSTDDLMMVTVLRRSNGTGLLDEYPMLAAYVARGEVRAASSRAFADQRAVFLASLKGS